MINVKSIWENQKPTGDIINKTKIREIEHLNCYVATNNITRQNLFILSVSNRVMIPELKFYRFKGAEIFTVEVDNNIELNIYLLDNDLRDIFSLFIQNILEDIYNTVTENEALTTTLNTVSKWKKLFDKINFNGLTLEQQKGLVGELLFFNYLLNNEKSSGSILQAWTGPDFRAKDFTFGSVGIEIKFTLAQQPRISISNESQLDSVNLSELFLVLYSSEEVHENGFSLNSLVEQTRQKISTDEELNFFNGRLQLVGYSDEDRDYYGRLYSLKKAFAFVVTADFPKIVKSQLALSIHDVSYSIEVSAIEKFQVETEEILQKI